MRPFWRTTWTDVCDAAPLAARDTLVDRPFQRRYSEMALLMYTALSMVNT